MLGGLFKTAAIVGIGAAVINKWTDLDSNSTTAILVSLGTAGVALTLIARERKLKANGRAVFITGCDSGFGHDLAKQLDKQGMRVFAGCLFANGPAAQELKTTCSERLEIIQLDITKEDQVTNAEEEVRRKLGGEELWGLVNNAGIMSFCDVEVTPIKEWQRLYDINVLGQVRMIQAFLPLLRRSKGRIVNIASANGRCFMPLYGAYCASKAAVIIYTECLRLELMKWGMHASTVLPSGFATNLVTNSKGQEAYFKGIAANLTDEQQKFYSKEYFDTLIQRFYFPYGKNVGVGLPSDFSPVVNAVSHALLSTKPREQYVAGIGGGFLVSLGTLLPYSLTNKLLLNIEAFNKSKGLHPTLEEVYGKK